MSVAENGKINVRGVYFDDVSMDEAVAMCAVMLGEEGVHVIHTPNAEIVELCVEHNEYYPLINSADLVIPDGSGVVLAAKILGRPLTKGKVAGVELVERLCALAADKGVGVYFLGGKPAVHAQNPPDGAADGGESEDVPSVADMAAKKLMERYPALIVSGTRDGYFKNDDEVVADINRSGARILFVCTGVPRQEKWIAAHRAEFENIRLCGGFGGSLDIYAGTAKRAPKIFIKTGCEWLYRLLCQPSRVGRMMKLPKFILGTIFNGKKTPNNGADTDKN
ncbi:MAG: WecB/TagA/CpsF family glycosyltransferase [Eubacteriales bacterium]